VALDGQLGWRTIGTVAGLVHFLDSLKVRLASYPQSEYGFPVKSNIRGTTMSKKTDTLTDFDKQLIAGMEEVVAHINSEPNNARTTVVQFADAKAIREGLGMSQAVFSRAYGIPLKTLQHWEQRRHNPDRTASAYLWTIEEFPDQVREAQQRHRMQQPAEIEQRTRL
jgi:putative transcriptional regulator